MNVQLTGDGFDIVPLSSSEQLLRPLALWQFDVTPQRVGMRDLQLSVAMRIPLPDRPDERVSMPVLERKIQVKVDARYSAARFVRGNWQWMVPPAAAGLGGAITAWIKLIQG